ncbi:ImmA/IrrE family metallo-endopeptidase [Marinomonas sp. BSi20584]|uniref:ImmA/IrrE family metallo-endopeptidase n=1 Tax=Marinomonas sp. BSi20584 TaxID=1594462 RepID=UPI000C1E3555|nr:ImmA/IrrE family metallo-endopeptidase [Marinomonas sp. BSi20584]
MYKLDPMEWADCYTPEELIKELFRQLPKLSFPIPLHKIAKSCGIEAIVDIATLPDVEEEPSAKFPPGFLIDENKERGFIFYKDFPDAPYRKRFTIAHELAHFLFPHHRNHLTHADLEAGSVGKNASTPEREREANDFANELLLPKHLFMKAIEGKEITLQFIKELSELTEFSVAPLANNCVKSLPEKALAVVHSYNFGQCSYIWANWDALPGEFSFWKKELLPEKSIFNSLTEFSEELVTEKQLTNDSWFKSLPDDFDGKIYEQTYFQKNGYAITLISVDC